MIKEKFNGVGISVVLIVTSLFLAGLVLFAKMDSFSFVVLIIVASLVFLFGIASVIEGASDMRATHIKRIPVGMYGCPMLELGPAMELDNEKYYSMTLQSLVNEKSFFQILVPEKRFKIGKLTKIVSIQNMRGGKIITDVNEKVLAENKRYNTPVSAQVKPAI